MMRIQRTVRSDQPGTREVAVQIETLLDELCEQAQSLPERARRWVLSEVLERTADSIRAGSDTNRPYIQYCEYRRLLGYLTSVETAIAVTCSAGDDEHRLALIQREIDSIARTLESG